MNVKVSGTRWKPSLALGVAIVLSPVSGAAQPPPQMRVTLDQAIEFARDHNHALQAARTTIQQNQAQEVTANLRPNPVLLGDWQFLPVFDWSNFNSDYLSSVTQFDLGVSYLFERGDKRARRLQAAKDQTAVTTAQVSDTERGLAFNVASQFVAAVLAESTLDFAQQALTSFQQTVTVSQDRFNAGGLSEGDLLKIKLQLLQFQMDVSTTRLAKVQAMASLRQLLGYELVPENYEVAGTLAYVPVRSSEDDLKALAVQQRPDLRAAQLGVTSAESQRALAIANGKRDVTAQFSYTHVAQTNTGSLFANIEIPIFDKNQGEIARTGFAVTQSQQLSSEQSSIVMTDVVNAYEAVKSAASVVNLYDAGYLKQAQDSLDISQYAFQRGAATLLDFLDAQRTYRSTQLAYRQALATYMLAVEQLRQAVGTRNLP
ncbi:MAG TPA: TolC family protein [Vicinamibacterales bacterium]|jgi:cobalt-zinc-cadmium efflux system outer membrane protein